MSKIDCVTIVPKFKLKAAAVVVASVRPFSRRLVICDIGAFSEPSDVILLRLLHAVQQRFHSL